MTLLLVAVTVGALIGLVRGGSLRAAGRVSLPKVPVLGIWASLALQLAASRAGEATSSRSVEIALLLAGYALVGAACLALWPRLRTASRAARTGAALAIGGWAANAVVVTANGGMPVSRAALRLAGYEGDPDFSAGILAKHVELGGAHFAALADVIPIPGLAIAVSAGDLALAVGSALLVFAALGGQRTERRWKSWSHASSSHS